VHGQGWHKHGHVAANGRIGRQRRKTFPYFSGEEQIQICFGQKHGTRKSYAWQAGQQLS
jgi:hypothetical protein